MTLVVGITGGIGCGKSTVCKAFEALGIETIDADACVHEVQQPGTEVFDAIVAAFGATALMADGTLDRRYLRTRVFSDDDARKRLESIVHPAVRTLIAERVRACRSPYCLVAIPLLVERGAYEFIDRVLVVDCDEATQIARVMARSGLDESEVRAIMATQATREARLARADDVIDNSGTRDALARDVAALDARYRRLAAREPASV